jgi:hypothetical protein
LAAFGVDYHGHPSKKSANNFSKKRMSKGLLLAVVFGIASFFTWNHFSKPEILSPEQEVENLIAKGTFSAVELAEMTDRFPTLVGRALRDRRVTVTGVLQKAVVKGVGSHDLILDLQGSRKRKISFASDVNNYARANNSMGKSKTKFQKFGREIVVYESAPTAAKASPGGGAIQKMFAHIIPAASQSELEPDVSNPEEEKEEGPTERVVFRELDTVTLEGIFQHITNANIFIEWRPSKSL